MRTLAMLKNGRKGRPGRRLLQEKVDGALFERKVERGRWLNVFETHDIEWSLDKVSRDAFQNPFDANGQTLDGVASTVRSEGEGLEALSIVRIEAPQDYDWRELIPFGATTKKGNVHAAGGFGEGIKMASLLLLRDYEASRVRVGSRDWEVEYYLQYVPRDVYRIPVRGLYAKKRSRSFEDGNYLEITFKGEKAPERAAGFVGARQFFYSSENPDFQGVSFDNKESGGFIVLPPYQKGHLYIAGQRTHFSERTQWDTIKDVHIWTWAKVQPKDRDRGLVTQEEMEEKIVPFIVGSMKREEMEKSVYDFNPLWERFQYKSIGNELLERIVKRLAECGATLQFPSECLANDLPGVWWLTDMFKEKGFRLCPKYMSTVGMKKLTEKFSDMQNHLRVEANKDEERRIALLQKAGKALGFDEEDLKEVWLFDQAEEASLFHGQYNTLFFWMAKEAVGKDFFYALGVYVHEMAHKAGNHGDPRFEYQIERYKQKVTEFILRRKTEWDALEEEWNQTTLTHEKVDPPKA